MMSKMKFNWLVIMIFALSFACPSNAKAEAQLPAIIGSNMVLQASDRVPIWGRALPAEKVTVKFDGQTVDTVTDRKGNWRVWLTHLKPGGPYDMTIRAKNTITLTNILVGEVWLCSGQSNMELELFKVKNGMEEIKRANYPAIRLFHVCHKASPTPLDKLDGHWEVCSPATAADFSSTAYFFGRSLHNQLHNPIGLIESAWGGTAAESWMSEVVLRRNPDLKEVFHRWDMVLAHFRTTLPNWYEDQFIRRHLPGPPRVNNKVMVPPDVEAKAMSLYIDPKQPGSLFNAMINPLIPVAFRGVIWYQGEQNTAYASEYKLLFPMLINNWRDSWHKRFPFLFVQLANYKDAKHPEHDWAAVRDAQLQTLSMPKTAMAVTIDIGDADDIHPRNKQEVGRRLALAALAKVYNRKIAYSGPLFRSMALRQDKAIISFSHVDSELKIGGGNTLSGFAIAGRDRKFVQAFAKIEKDKVVVFSPEVTKPIAVRYGWENSPHCNLYNEANLPASPFRTDKWPSRLAPIIRSDNQSQMAIRAKRSPHNLQS